MLGARPEAFLIHINRRAEISEAGANRFRQSTPTVPAAHIARPA